jgi:hypothetical protein
MHDSALEEYHVSHKDDPVTSRQWKSELETETMEKIVGENIEMDTQI